VNPVNIRSRHIAASRRIFRAQRARVFLHAAVCEASRRSAPDAGACRQPRARSSKPAAREAERKNLARERS